MSRALAAKQPNKQERGPGRRWQKGQSGNPKGRPRKERSLTDALRKLVDPEKLATALLEEAYSRNVNAIKQVYERLEGTPMPADEIERIAREMAERYQDVVEPGEVERIIEDARRARLRLV